MSSKILVTGATGTTGREVVKQAADAGHRVRALVRDTKKARVLLGSDVELVEGDLAIPESLDRAVEGTDAVFLLSSADPEQDLLQGNLVLAAERAGVGRVVKLAALGTAEKSSVGLLRLHRKTEKQIEASGLDYTHLHPHYFMQNLLNFAGTIKGQGTVFAPMKEGKIALVDVRDIAAVAVRALTEAGHAGKTYEITGPESLSFADIADRLSRTLGKDVKYVDVPPEAARKAMLDSGMPEFLVTDLLKLFAIFAGGHASAVSPVVPDVTGRKARSIDDFAMDYAQAFV